MRRCIAGLTSLLFVFGAMQVQAFYLETFYPAGMLTFWQSRYPQINYVASRLDTIVGVLTDREQGGPRSGQAFSGLYEGAFSSGGSAGVKITVRFERNNQSVFGEYTYGLGAGKINGIVEGNRLYFQWREGSSYGQGLFNASQDGNQFEGTWGYEQSRDNGGRWTGKRN